MIRASSEAPTQAKLSAAKASPLLSRQLGRGFCYITRVSYIRIEALYSRRSKGAFVALQVRVVRIFNTYGPRMALDDGRVVSNFVTQALTGTPLTIYGDGQQTRSFQYISDLIKGAWEGLQPAALPALI